MYKYYCRPGYGTKDLLLEIFNEVENKSFLDDLFLALKSIKPQINDIEDLWMNDEILINVNSDLGKFTISIDNYDMAFIIAENNQKCILEIDKLLINNNLFKKIQTDFKKYTL